MESRHPLAYDYVIIAVRMKVWLHVLVLWHPAVCVRLNMKGLCTSDVNIPHCSCADWDLVSSPGITVLLSLTVFMLLVAEIMPATSDSVPLIGEPDHGWTHTLREGETAVEIHVVTFLWDFCIRKRKLVPALIQSFGLLLLRLHPPILSFFFFLRYSSELWTKDKIIFLFSWTSDFSWSKSIFLFCLCPSLSISKLSVLISFVINSFILFLKWKEELQKQMAK